MSTVSIAITVTYVPVYICFVTVPITSELLDLNWMGNTPGAEVLMTFSSPSNVGSSVYAPTAANSVRLYAPLRAWNCTTGTMLAASVPMVRTAVMIALSLAANIVAGVFWPWYFPAMVGAEDDFH